MGVEQKQGLDEKVLETQEIELSLAMEKLALPFDEFVVSRLNKGFTHIGYGEDHRIEQLHSSVVSLLPKLASQGIQTVCLEIEDLNQDHINKYLKTGSEESLLKVIDQEKEMIAQGYTEGRIGGAYFNIIRIARSLGLKVVAMDNHDSNNRDEYMATKIPADKSLIYVGQVHLRGKHVEHGGIPKYLLENNSINCYTIDQKIGSEAIEQFTSRKALSRRIHNTAMQSSRLRSLGSFGVDIGEQPEIKELYQKFMPSNPIEYYGDGLIYWNV